MKKTIYILFVSLTFILSSCYRPQIKKTAQPEAVATLVAMTLAPNTENISPPDPAIQQSEQAPEIPTITFTPIIVTETPTETVQPSETPTATLTPTETVSLNDPKQNLGNPIWVNHLDSGSSFGLDAAGYDDGNTKFAVTGGHMVMQSFSSGGYRGWRLTTGIPDNFFLESKFIVDACSGNDQYGLVFRSNDYGNGYGYYLALTCNGNYSLTRWDSNGLSFVQGATNHTSINQGSGANNTLAIMAKNGNYKVFINNEFINEFNDNTFTSGDKFGAFLSGYSSGLTVRMDEIAYWNNP
ncbi:MAG: hypothetical protein JEZ06_18130 [Anaerolineaceae bacterium]|nr:hypothetical protein [Anaerolineaceae bacterium]